MTIDQKMDSRGYNYYKVTYASGWSEDYDCVAWAGDIPINWLNGTRQTLTEYVKQVYA